LSGRDLVDVDNRNEIREFPTSRRGRITPEQAGLPTHGGHRRVPGLRQEEAAMLTGVSVNYYTRLERANLNGVAESVLDALRLDDAERAHLFGLARAANSTLRTHRRPRQQQVRPGVQRLLDAMTSAWTSWPPTNSATRSTRTCTPSRPGRPTTPASCFERLGGAD
jgi:transcriptional regulator with XRE-family HTH domain